MYCIYCGQPINEDSVYCPFCGKNKKMKESIFCPKCGSKNIDYLTRIIGYLKRVSSFNEARQIEEGMREYNKL